MSRPDRSASTCRSAARFESLARAGAFGSLVALAGLVALVVLLSAAEAGASIYKYVDRSGVTHYTDSLSQVPGEYRNQVEDITGEVDGMGFNVVEGIDGAAPKDGKAGEGEGVDLELPEGSLPGGEAASQLLDNFGFGIVLLILLAIPALYVVSALILKLACRLGGEEPPGLGRACLVLFVQGVAGTAVGAAFGGIGMLIGIEEAGVAVSAGLSVVSALCSWLANAAVLSSMLSCAFVRALWIGVIHTVLVLVIVAVPIGLLIFFIAAMAA